MMLRALVRQLGLGGRRARSSAFPSPGVPGPTIIGGTGGSGTRVVARVVRRGGMYIGTGLYGSEDPPELGIFSDRWINLFMTRERWGLPEAVEAAMAGELAKALERHLAALDGTAVMWGWKEPRSIFLLPFFERHLPGMRFVHVVRDGRDMAFSANQNQLNKHGHTLLEPLETQQSQPVRSMLLWSRLNLLAADHGARVLGPRYHRLRFEDLCHQPAETLARLFDFLGLDRGATGAARAEVEAPPSLGRWRMEDAAMLESLERHGHAALERFGYAHGG